jgi:non-ribosomal peptide synthetase-like protein
VIPRTVERDDRFDRFRHGEALRRGLAGKNRHNLVTMGLFLLVRWSSYFVLTALAMAAWGLYERLGLLALGGLTTAAVSSALVHDLTAERLLVGRRRLRPQVCSIYQPYFWWHERYWKLQTADSTLPLLNGTPFKGLAWRFLGVRTGRRLFDDGCSMPERSLVILGDDCVLNTGSVLQCHSMEDGTFRSDVTRLGDRCTLDVAAYVHYGVTVGDDTVVGPDSFVMKGSRLPPGTRWSGNPAGETPGAAVSRAA